jgi:hypothetical protein
MYTALNERAPVGVGSAAHSGEALIAARVSSLRGGGSSLNNFIP